MLNITVIETMNSLAERLSLTVSKHVNLQLCHHEGASQTTSEALVYTRSSRMRKKGKLGYKAIVNSMQRKTITLFADSKPTAKEARPHAVTDHDRRAAREFQAGRKSKCKENNKPQ